MVGAMVEDPYIHRSTDQMLIHGQPAQRSKKRVPLFLYKRSPMLPYQPRTLRTLTIDSSWALVVGSSHQFSTWRRNASLTTHIAVGSFEEFCERKFADVGEVEARRRVKPPACVGGGVAEHDHLQKPVAGLNLAVVGVTKPIVAPCIPQAAWRCILGQALDVWTKTVT